MDNNKSMLNRLSKVCLYVNTRHVSCLFEQIRISFFAVALNTNKQILAFIHDECVPGIAN